MELSRKQIYDLLFPVVWKSSSTTATPESIRKYLESASDTELKSMLEAQVRAGTIKLPLSQEDVEQELQNARVELEVLRQEGELRIRQAQAERRMESERHRAQLQVHFEPQDRRAFEAASRLLGFGNNQANWNITRQIIGFNFTVEDIRKQIESGRLMLSGPDLDEQKQRENQIRQQLVETADKYLEDRGPESFQIREWIRSGPIGEVQPRVTLVAKIADHHSRDFAANQLRFRSLFLSITNIAQLQHMVGQIEQRQSLRSMTKQELRDYIKTQGAQQ